MIYRDKLFTKPAKILSQKIIPDVNAEFKKSYDFPEGHGSMAFFSCSNDDIAYIAADQATKNADIHVLHASTYYGGGDCAWSTYGGSISVFISGPKVEDVRKGLEYVNAYVETECRHMQYMNDGDYMIYAQCVPRVGKYYSETLGIPEGSAYGYLLGPPIEANFAIDAALKSGDVKLADFWMPPAKTNSCGGIVFGSESACQSATEAFVETLCYCFDHKLEI